MFVHLASTGHEKPKCEPSKDLQVLSEEYWQSSANVRGQRFVKFFDMSYEATSPWIHTLHGFSRSVCPTCQFIIYDFADQLRAELDRWTGALPDVIGCGHYPLLAFSSRVMNDWKKSCDVGRIPVGSIEVPGSRAPYYWVKGELAIGAQITRYLNGRKATIRYCPTCGAVTNPEFEEKLAISTPTWDGSHVFTTRFSPARLFCTDRVVRCAARNKHTNVSFSPADVD